MTEYFVITPCPSSNGFEIKLRGHSIDLKRAEAALGTIGQTVASSPVVLLAKVRQHPVSIYKSGRMLVKNNEKLDEETATAIAHELLEAFERTGAIL